MRHRRPDPLGVTALGLFLFMVAVSAGIAVLNLGGVLASFLDFLGRLS